LAAFADINAKLLSTGQKIDIAMVKARLAMRQGEWAEAKERITEAKTLNETGGDWDRRNRLKVYEGVLSVGTRDFTAAAALLLDSTATFTAVELCGYTEFVLFAVVAALKVRDRGAVCTARHRRRRVTPFSPRCCAPARADAGSAGAEEARRRLA